MNILQSIKELLIIVLAVVGAFAITGVVGAFTFTRWPEPYVGPLCAVAVVLTTYWAARKRKKTAGFIALVVGSTVAWLFLKDSYFPEPHPQAYQQTYLPFVFTVAAGTLTFLICGMLWKEAQKSPPNPESSVSRSRHMTPVEQAPGRE
jgi:cytochrome bd-type quinol oxidase subunit 2